MRELPVLSMARAAVLAYSGEVDPLIRELHALPWRFGPRPRSSAGLPFRQLDQFPPPGIIERLHGKSLELQGVRSRQSRFASPRSRALWLTEPAAPGPPHAFIDGREFCHLHEPPDGSIHLTLPPAVVETVVARGWAERHPIHSLGVHPALVLVYAPRDSAELDTVFRLVASSWRFAGGLSLAIPVCA
jgi:phospholipase/carboxylesterase